jgi:hypothetical protein
LFSLSVCNFFRLFNSHFAFFEAIIMAASTRGKNRETIYFIQLTTVILWGFKPVDWAGTPGVSDVDTILLGWKDEETAGKIETSIRIYGANSPRPPRYKKILNKNPTAGQRGSISAFGKGELSSAELKAFADSGWQQSKPARGLIINANARTETVGCPLSNGGLYLLNCEASKVAAYADSLGLVRATSLRTNTNNKKKCFTGTNKPQPIKVRKVEDNGTLTMPCSPTKLSTVLSVGWVLAHEEIKSPYDPAEFTVKV